MKAAQGDNANSFLPSNMSGAPAVTSSFTFGVFDYADPDEYANPSTKVTDPSNAALVADDAKAAANSFYNIAQPYLTTGHLLPALYLGDEGGEGGFNSPNDSIFGFPKWTWSEIAEWVAAWTKQVQLDAPTVCAPILYMTQGYAANISPQLINDYSSSPIACQLWVADINDSPNIDSSPSIGSWPTWAIEQYDWTGATPPGNLDALNPNPSLGGLSSLVIGYTPAQIRNYYGLNQVTFNGTGQTIAIVELGNDPTLQSDLTIFDSQEGLAAPPSLTIVGQDGSPNLPTPPNTDTREESLDVEWAHAIAPGASILVVEATVSSDDATTFNNLFVTAVVTAASWPGVSVVSISYDCPEVAYQYDGVQYAGLQAPDSTYTTPPGHQGVTFVASSGDGGSYPVGAISDGNAVNSPANSPNVLAVGGTTLQYDANGNPVSETGWGYDSTQTPGDFVGSGGGVSVLEPEPSYQTAVAGVLSGRGVPDVAFEANGNTGVQLYDASAGGWFVAGGTSLGAPCWAAIIAIANQGRALQGHATLNGATDPTLPVIYSLPASDFNDIISGTNGAYNCKSGYNLVTGRGTPVANKLIPELVAAETQTATTTTVTSSNASSNYGQSVTFTATVTPASGSGETGTVQFQIDGNNVGSPVTLSGGTATYSTSMLGVGSHSVVAIYSGDSNFVGSTASPLNQFVGKAVLMVTADNQTMVYGAALPTLTASYSGFVNGETQGTSGVIGSPNVTASVTTTSPVGTYAIQVAQGTLTAQNYSFSFVSGTLTVTQEVLTVNSVQTLDSLEASSNVQVVIASGGDLTVNNPINLDSNGEVSVLDGGRITLLGIDSQPGATGINLDDGTLRASGSFTTTAPLTVGTGGATIDSNGFDLVIAGTVTGLGGLTTTGTGTVILSGNDNYTGGTTVSGSTFDVTAASALPSSGLVTISGGGRLVLGSGNGIGSPLAASSPAASSDATTPSDATAAIIVVAPPARQQRPMQ